MSYRKILFYYQRFADYYLGLFSLDFTLCRFIRLQLNIGIK